MAKRVTIKLKCLQCSKIIPPTKKPRRKKYCDDHCRWRWHNAQREKAYKLVKSGAHAQSNKGEAP